MPMPPVQALSVPHVDAAHIVVDGEVSDAGWANAVALPAFTTSAPEPGLTPAFQTDVTVLSDDKALYLRIVAHDPEPRKLRTGLGRRDARMYDDLVTVYLDPAGTGQRAWMFAVNPSGARLDGIRTATASMDDYAWDGRWDAATRISQDGWTAEIAIPWRTVRHASDVDTIGLLVMRDVPRTGEESTWPATNPQTPGFLSEEGVIGGPGKVPRSAGVDVIPELTFGWNEAGPDSERWTVEGIGPGATVHWSPGTASLVAAVNPDFAQVESDTPQIATNRRYALYFEEKRPFFLDGQEAFQSPAGDLVYTRSIGVPRYGVRATQETGNGRSQRCTPWTQPPGRRSQRMAGGATMSWLARSRWTRSRGCGEISARGAMSASLAPTVN